MQKPLRNAAGIDHDAYATLLDDEKVRFDQVECYEDARRPRRCCPRHWRNIRPDPGRFPSTTKSNPTGVSTAVESLEYRLAVVTQAKNAVAD